MAFRSRKNYTRAEREAMVLQTFAIDVQHREHKFLTPNQICKRLEITRWGGINRMLNDMVFDGRLICRESQRQGRWPGLEYKLAPGTYQEPSPRTIKLSVKGKFWDEVFS